MNWYKVASDLETFEDRNRFNKRIRDLEKIMHKVKYLSKYVYQNASHAKQVVKALSESKLMSSFPGIVKVFRLAETKALDNYDLFAICMEEAMDRLFVKIEDLKQQRHDFVHKELPRRWKEKRNGKEEEGE